MSRYARELDLRELNAHTQGILLTPPGSDVLDVGTADGHPVVEGLKARGCRVWGVEIDPDAAATAAALCEQMVVGNVETLDLDAAFGDRRFDVLLCLDVLEHLIEPLDALKRLTKLLTPTGIVVASIPNVTHAAVRLQLLEGKFTYTDTGLLDRTHVRFFDRTEVESLFAGAGLTVVERLEVRREVHETEIPLDLEGVPAETLETVKADPDARVFQWMLVARAAVQTDGSARRGQPAREGHPRLGRARRLARRAHGRPRPAAHPVGHAERARRRARPHPARAHQRARHRARDRPGAAGRRRGQDRLRRPPAAEPGHVDRQPAGRAGQRRGRARRRRQGPGIAAPAPQGAQGRADRRPRRSQGARLRPSLSWGCGLVRTSR